MDLPENTTKASIFGATMLNGILYCAHCGKKLVGGYATKYRSCYVDHRPIYRCYNGNLNPHTCDGPRTYSAAKLEGAVLESVYSYFDTISETAADVWKDRARQQMRNGAKFRVKKAEAALARLQKEQEGLKKELMKVVTGDSSFDRNLLQSMLDENQKAMDRESETIRDTRAAADREADKMAFLENHLKDIENWKTRFDFMSVDEQRAVLTQLIDRIEVSRDYRMKIVYTVSLEDFYGDDTLAYQELA